jgi:anti-sigma-K factor RskA
MTRDLYLELAPAHALGALDADERLRFESHADACGACRAELRAYQTVAAALAQSLPAIRPSPTLRRRVLTPGPAATPRRPRPRRLLSGLAAAAVLVLALSLGVVRGQRDDARRQLATARAAAARAGAALVAAERELAEAQAFRALVQRGSSRIATLAGLAPAPRASARVVFDPETREAVLVASGLDPVPAGKAYEAWVIAAGAPVPAGLFRPDTQGRAVLRLPPIDATRAARTFAVTLEPEAGTSAPTGPMVLAGSTS